VSKADGNGTFYSRIQKGKDPKKSDMDGDRIINTKNDGNTYNKQYVNPNGSPISSASKNERKQIGHIHLESKTGS